MTKASPSRRLRSKKALRQQRKDLDKIVQKVVKETRKKNTEIVSTPEKVTLANFLHDRYELRPPHTFRNWLVEAHHLLETLDKRYNPNRA